MKITSDKAYLLGLLIGGGILKSNNLQIILPYKKWGDLSINPHRGGQIANDILRRIKPLWKQVYDVEITYKIDSEWKINFEIISDSLRADLKELNLYSSGEFRKSADISGIINELKANKLFAKFFMAGIVDTVGSLTKSHRRFIDEFQIVSLEFKGRNFKLVADIVSILNNLSCVPDQVLWNHPNQHSSLDRYYNSWKKGFKIRALLDDYVLHGSFVSESKQLSAQENSLIQKRTNKTTNQKKVSGLSRTTLHLDEKSDWLPDEIRGKHFLHFRHLGLIYGAELQGPKIDKDLEFEKYICPFTLLTKGNSDYIKNIIDNENYLKLTKYKYKEFDISKLLKEYRSNNSKLLFGNTSEDGFLVNYLLQAAVYVLTAEKHPELLRGKRILGNYLKLASQYAKSSESFTIGLPDKGTCVIIKKSDHSALTGYINNEFNKTLIEKNNIFFSINEPVFDKCIKLKH